MAKTKKEKFLIIVSDSADTKTEPFDQIVEALTDAGIDAEVHELEDDDIFTGGAN